MLNLRNNFIMAPVKLGYSDGLGIVTQRHIEFYKRRSRHVGAITLEPLYMNAGLRELPTQLGIDKDEKIEGLRQLNNIIHKNGAKSIAHLNHPGRMANPKIPNNFFWSSTDKTCENGGAKPLIMTEAMMEEVTNLFVKSSKRAVEAGFDIIEIQFGLGYLMAQFISPAVNDRTDNYGGDFGKRIIYPLQVAKAIREAVEIPIIARISGDEMIPDGYHIDDMIRFTQSLQDIGFDAIHVSAGSACSTPPWFFQHMFIKKGKTWELASKIQQNINIPVIYVGRINSEKDIKFINENYNAKYIALGRALVADPDFIGKYLKTVDGQIRPCLACAEGCLGGVKQGKGLGCVVNPLVNTNLPELKKVDNSKRFVIIGGGLAGMEAALRLNEKGHYVDLYEKNELGGQFKLAYLPPNKESLKDIIDYYIAEIKSRKINVIYKDATISDIEKGNYNGIIMASGAIPAIPPIKGLKEYYWTEFLEDSQLPKDKKLLIIGGGLIGLEIASKLVSGNNKVVVVEMLDEIARGMEMIEKAMTVKKLKASNTEIYTNYRVTEVNDSEVIIEGKEGKKIISGIDKIVVTTGMKSYRPIDYSGNLEVYYIGDANKPGKAQEAIHDAYELCTNL